MLRSEGTPPPLTMYPNAVGDILDVVTKRLVDIDDALLERARAAAGTATIKDTVAVALDRLVDRESALRHVRRLRRKGALDLQKIERSRRPRAAS
jgi:Arc/MetJ family transcription regulator